LIKARARATKAACDGSMRLRDERLHGWVSGAVNLDLDSQPFGADRRPISSTWFGYAIMFW